MEPTKRGWVHTGFSCNLKCDFCSYYDSLKDGNKSLDTIKSELKRFKSLGMKDVTFSGGEVTIRRDIFDMLAYAKELGYNDIHLITNGSRTHSMDYCKKLVDSGLTTITFSLEGHNPETHEKITMVKGTYDKVIASYENMQKLGVNIRMNMTITKNNYKVIPEMAELLASMKPRVVNLLTFFDYDDASNHFKEQCPKYSDLREYLKKGLDIMDPVIPEINIRYLPFCVIPEYSHLITGYHQKMYQQYEWNNIIDDLRRHNKLVNYYHLLRGIFSFKNKKQLLKLPFSRLMNEAMIEFIVKNSFTQNKKCNSCKYKYICNGFWKGYVKTYGDEEFSPQIGEKIEDPLFFKRGLFPKWEESKKYHF